MQSDLDTKKHFNTISHSQVAHNTINMFNYSIKINQVYRIKVQCTVHEQSTVSNKISQRSVSNSHMQCKSQGSSHITHTLKSNEAQLPHLVLADLHFLVYSSYIPILSLSWTEFKVILHMHLDS